MLTVTTSNTLDELVKQKVKMF